jgi:hypothetical protein
MRQWNEQRQQQQSCDWMESNNQEDVWRKKYGFNIL